jgi:hypothetical protein
MAVTTVQLPDVTEWIKASYQQNRSPWERSLLIKDFAYTADAHPITILPFGTQKIDGQATAVVSSAGDAVQLYPLEDLTGWFLVKSGGGGAVTVLSNSAIEFIINNPVIGVAGDVGVPWDCTITGATLLADQSGSIAVDIWNGPYATYPPILANSIVGGAPPTITANIKSQDVTLVGWTKNLAAGSTLRYNVNSVSVITRCTVWLAVTKTI